MTAIGVEVAGWRHELGVPFVVSTSIGRNTRKHSIPIAFPRPGARRRACRPEPEGETNALRDALADLATRLDRAEVELGGHGGSG